MEIDLASQLTHALNISVGEILRKRFPESLWVIFHLFWEVLVCDVVITLHCQHFYHRSVTKGGKIVSGFES